VKIYKLKGVESLARPAQRALPPESKQNDRQQFNLQGRDAPQRIIITHRADSEEAEAAGVQSGSLLNPWEGIRATGRMTAGRNRRPHTN
jgi:hypothetical protein